MLLCSKIQPGNNTFFFVVVGTCEGSLQIFDLITSAMIIEVENALDGAVWCLGDVSMDGRTIILFSRQIFKVLEG